MMELIEKPSLAILIDCWFLGRFENISISERIYSNITKFLDTNKNIETVVLASYNCRTEWLSTHPWFDNYRSLFEDSNAPRRIRDLAVVHNLHRQYDEPYVNKRTDPLIINYHNDAKYHIAMWWGWELEYYLKLNQHIKNVYVLGAAWDSCVKLRPLGYDALAEIPNINLLTHTDCSGNMDGSSVELDSDPSWKKLEEKIYQYVK